MTNELNWVLSLRSEELTSFFKFFRLFASENFYLITISLGYWCWKRHFFRDLAIIVCLSTMLNLLLKELFQIPRPTIEHLVPVLDPFGFPSGDVQVITTIWLTLAWHFQKTALWIFSFLLILFVGLSRIYLGVHSPLDVLAGILIGFLIYLGYVYIQKSKVQFKLNFLFFNLFLGSLGIYFLIMHNYLNNMNISTAGTLLGIVIGEILYQHFDVTDINNLTQNKKWLLILAIFGLSTVWILRKSLSLSWHFDPILYRFMSYTIIGIYLIFVVPIVFEKSYILLKKRD